MITIITVYKSNNYGSFLQAKALAEALSQYDDVQFLDFGQRKFFDLGTIHNFWNNMSKGFSLEKIKFIIVSFFCNYRFWRNLKSISVEKFNNEENSVIVVGSDEIWNISRSTCSNHYFWAAKLKGKKISYAPSINEAKISFFQNFPTAEYLNDFKCISVRDSYSKEVLSKFTEKSIEVVLDPTMLYGADFYKRNAKHDVLPFKYIALYFVSGNSDLYRETILRFAKEKNLKTVSVGNYLSWCDVNITPASSDVPFLYYLNAEYVFTGTFHGTAFAINFEKEFFTFAKSEKIRELLKIFGLENRNILNLEYECIVKKCDNKIDYSEVNRIKNALRAKSLEFIQKSFNE